jgi:formamidopyrimidine-DNA glycosylase
MKGSALKPKSAELLVHKIKAILEQAILQGGTTLNDFKQSDGKPGYFKQHLLVYGRKDQNCYDCNSQIEVIKCGQRSTFFCPSCQKS